MVIAAPTRHYQAPLAYNRFARSAAESARPNDWWSLEGLWMPSLGPPGGLTLRDWSGHGSHGTLSGTGGSVPVYLLDPIHRWVLDYDSNNTNFIQTTNIILKTAANFTIVVWFKADVTAFGHHLVWQGDVLGNGGGAEEELSIMIGDATTGGGNVLTSFLEGDTGDLLISTAFTDTVDWHMGVFTFKDINEANPSSELFLDGESKGTDSLSADGVTRTGWDTDFRIGRPMNTIAISTAML